MKYLIVVPDGVGIRNFFCTKVIDRLLDSGEVCVWHALPKESVAPFQDRWKDRVRWEGLPPFSDGLVERIFRQSKIYAQLYWQRRLGPDVQLRRLKPPRAWKPRLLDVLERLMGRICSRPWGIQLLDRGHQAMAARAPHTRAFEEFLRSYRPDIVFCTHQRAIHAVPAMAAARTLRIPTAVFIYSWDNLPKGRMAVYADTYIVWSDHMKEELLGYYPDVREGRVHVVGTPQFENYFDESLRVSREKFFADLGLDAHRPVVCFSGNDIKSPFDPDFLEDLASSLRGTAPERRPQILFRRSPVDTSDRFDGVLSRYPEIVVSNPLWQMVRDGDWSQLVPTAADGALLANVVYHSDIVINVGSTMGMDFAIFDKPAIYVNYTPPGKGHLWNIREVYKLPHFASVHKLQPVFWANSPRELGELVQYALEHPELKKKEREAWLHLIVKQPLGGMAERFSEELRALASNGHSSQGSNR